MKKYIKLIGIILFILIVILYKLQSPNFEKFSNESKNGGDSIFLTYLVNPKEHNISMVWKNNNGKMFNNINNVRQSLSQQNIELIFAMNGGMYHPGHLPNGLYVENSKTMVKLDIQKKEKGYFYVQPNGVFYLTEEKNAFIRKTEDCIAGDFVECNKIQYATQSGPMLVSSTKITPNVEKLNTKRYIMNGVGIKSNGELAFVMSKEKITHYDFAKYFVELGCENALYLDGAISRTYLPSKNWEQLDGNFGVMIIETK